jgi:stage II sporulation protein D
MKFVPAVCFFAAAMSAAPLDLKVENISKRQIQNIPLERYVAAVLAGEAGDFRSGEALKAMAVISRTYAIRMRGRHAAEGFDLCDTTHCQHLDLTAVTPRLEDVARQTEGEMLWYQGKLAFTPYSKDCAGHTEDAAAVWPDESAPYLRSHEDIWCRRGGNSRWRWVGDVADIFKAMQTSLLRTPRDLNRISIAGRTAGGRASELVLSGSSGSVRIAASSFRFAIGRDLGWNTIRSDNYTVHTEGGRAVFEGSGSGHGVGLCQKGADQMGNAGKTYREILAYYFPGAVIGLNAQGIHWQRLTGESVALLTTQPEQDRAVLATADKTARTLAARTGWRTPANTEIRVYPDLDSFRDATAEPGWVAAHTNDTHIQLQPVSVLRSRGVLDSTIAHELLHLMMEPIASPTLPLWFREGFVSFLDGDPVTGKPEIPSENDLRQTSDPGRARRAYADAEALVASLARTYGETTVIGWVARGLPPEVTKARSSQPMPKSR